MVPIYQIFEAGFKAVLLPNGNKHPPVPTAQTVTPMEQSRDNVQYLAKHIQCDKYVLLVYMWRFESYLYSASFTTVLC